MEDYPLEGILLSKLQSYIIEKCTTSGLNPYMITTAEFVQKIVIPETSDTKQALITKFTEVTPIAKIFVSHAWSGQILDTLQAVEQNCGLSQENMYIWLDCCSVNQHDLKAKPTEWYSTTFHEAIQKIGYTCLVLTPIMNPTPLKRSWCLWELFGTLKMNTTLKICVPESQTQILLTLMKKDFVSIMTNICSVDASKAEAFSKIDRDRIREAIQSSVGMEKINQAALDPLRKWLLETATKELTIQSTSSSTSPELLRGLGALRYDLGKIEQAQEAFEECLKQRKVLLISSSLEEEERKRIESAIAGDLTNIGACEFELGNIKQSLKYYEEALQLRIKLQETDLAISYNNTGLAYKALKQYGKAKECFENALKYAKECENVQAERYAKINKGELLREIGEPQKAVEILEEILKSQREEFGDNEHIHIAQIMNLLGQAYLDLKKYSKAEELFNNSLRIRTRALGDAHPRVALVVANLAKLDYLRGKKREATQRYDQLIEIQTKAFGIDHPFVQETIKMKNELIHTSTIDYDRHFMMHNLVVGPNFEVVPPPSPSIFSQAAVMIEIPKREEFRREVSAMDIVRPSPLDYQEYSVSDIFRPQDNETTSEKAEEVHNNDSSLQKQKDNDEETNKEEEVRPAKITTTTAIVKKETRKQKLKMKRKCVIM